ncbi:translation elongation factor Ts [Propylenella binzhouense]|uniref:Elongation factor Ts n=1 Tax=Propylenella binzhouense TaxID=2555902 RepID=A0A964WT80_9HYPH|nr:translation elongation factor Ts [Propylenella binzhouense]MYZ47734.1 elongation factor Ts [Propylenella binzhouense]
MAITAQMVKELREKTGAGMMDCKTALQESGGDMEAAVDWLRTKGLAKAAKKAGRVAAEGLVGIAEAGRKAAIVELNSETDFVARNDRFQALVTEVAEAALTTDGSLEAVMAAKLPKSGKTVEAAVTDAVATIGENMTLRRSAALEVDEGVVAGYIHAAAAPGLGKIGVIVGVRSAGDSGKLYALGRQIAMHVAAASPLALDVSDLDPAVVARERAVYAEQARGSGKPEAIIDKMVEGRLRKFYEEAVLLKQVFVIDGERSVETVLRDAQKDVGAPVALTGFVCFRLGEGVEREEADFAAEVAAAVGQR